MIKITLKDGSVKEYDKPTTAFQVANDISEGLARVACAAEINDELVDLRKEIHEYCSLNILTFDSDGGKHAYWHTSTHVMAQAVKRIFPEAKLAIGPAIDNGFYYDFDVEKTFTPEDLEKIEGEMKKIIKEKHKIDRFELPRQEAMEKMKDMGEDYKVELIEGLPEDSVISFYQQGEFIDLCAGPHLMNTGNLKAYKLLSIAGAYWRGDEKNKMLQRIYGTAYPKKAMLDDYINRLEEAKRRDHRKLGKELDLFSIQEEGPGFPFFHPKGMVLRNVLENFWRQEHDKYDYQEIKTPVILDVELWKRSGHWGHYKENMYFTQIDDREFAVKPMNCPGGMLMYKRAMHSYRDLPIKMAELGLVHRHELSGALHGLMRVRNFTQDDAHIYMTKEQIKEQIIEVIELTDKIYKVFGFTYRVELSTKPEKAMGDDKDWDIATDALRETLEEKAINYRINEGDGAFYGPKIDFHLEDCIGRTWQCGTIQLDFQMPERFDLTYIGADGEKHRPVMVHRTVLGSIERFIGILIEHYAGAFPLWLSPEQVRIMPIAPAHHEYAKEIAAMLKDNNIRAELDLRDEKIGYKIREAQLQKTPYMLILGQKEVDTKTVSVRSRREGDLGFLGKEDVLKNLLDEIKEKRN
ncbi:threonine--tRNA ligase [Alkalibacter saccharofermentans]|uniref:Threonine--tRNA ligase n=1 Tax=Alkalibacter saccharofermentans DSM 14828 TaxID=1120975 RepID=A0A1M4UDJ1_9FIRM|nr:threonine--tRNA ligase [Alkalibacter saccharofermentans]SHE54667.1 threonyl-tRNA synthetase [Alkalibacter saccharofermentans DSM 14828]